MNALTAWLRAPFDNPVMRREVRLITRRGYFAWVVLVLTVAMTLVIASVGGTSTLHPAYVGKVLFQTYFGMALALVFVAGPAVAASSIASEREGRTYEALVLTGMPPRAVAWGKFVAAATHVGAYVAALAPVGALPFLFGGVSAVAMLAAFAMLAVATTLAVLLGLAISARLPTTRAALITSVLAGAAVALALHTVVGETVGDVVCRAMGMARPGTIWLPVLLAEGDLSFGQVLALVTAPLAFAGLVGWYLFETCTACLSDASADRATGIKRWFAASVVLGALMASATIVLGNSRGERADAAITACGVYLALAVYAAFVFQGDEVAAPRRVRLLWKARGTGVIRRFFGPGVASSAALQLAAGAVVLGTTAAVGLLCVLADDIGEPGAPLGVIAIVPPIAMFVVFVVGLATWLRVRWGAVVGRLVLAVTLVVLFVAPYAVTAILGGSGGSPDSFVPLLAAPSPAFALEVARHVTYGQAAAEEVLATLLCTGFYTIVGIATLTWGLLGAEREVRGREADAAKMDALIAAEDAGNAPAVSPAPRTTVVAAQPAQSVAHAVQPSGDERYMPPAERPAAVPAMVAVVAREPVREGVSPRADDAVAASPASAARPTGAVGAPTAPFGSAATVAMERPVTPAIPPAEAPASAAAASTANRTPPHGTLLIAPRTPGPPDGESSGSSGAST